MDQDASWRDGSTQIQVHFQGRFGLSDLLGSELRAASSLEESVCISLTHICQLGLWMVSSLSTVSLKFH